MLNGMHKRSSLYKVLKGNVMRSSPFIYKMKRHRFTRRFIGRLVEGLKEVKGPNARELRLPAACYVE